MIAATRPSVLIRSSQQGIYFRTREKVDQSPRETLAGDGQHALDLGRVGWRLEGGVPEEGMDRRQPQIPAANAQALLLLQTIQKCHDQRGIDLLEVQTGWRLMQPLFGELQELSEGVSIGTDRVRARPSLLHQALCEKTFQERREAGESSHCRPSQRCSSLRIASRISSGEPLKYHCVSATCTWPR